MSKLEVKTRGKGYVLYTTGEIRLDMVRGSYVHALKAFKKKNAPADQEGKFGIVGLLPKETHAAAKDACVARIAELCKENKVAKVATDDKFIRNGDDSAKPEYEDHFTVNASELRPPKLRDRQGNLLDRNSDAEQIRDLFQSGHWFNILIRPWFQDNEHGKKVNAGLIGIQFVKKDKTFGQGEIDESDAWDTVDDGDDGMGSSTTTVDDDDGL